LNPAGFDLGTAAHFVRAGTSAEGACSLGSRAAGLFAQALIALVVT
jgi:hypothetical protein